ncbi:MAG: hypothetical protein IPM60_01790 [Rhodospirillales bacterium]|nr:hypothetical protein [Rhodospirillales bacterium]
MNLPIGIELACVLVLVIFPLASADLLIFKVYGRDSAGLQLPVGGSRRGDLRRVAVKCVGFYATLLVVAAMYFAFPIYRQDYYQPFFSLAALCVPPILAVAPLYIWLLDRRMACPRDGTWQAGRLFLGYWRGLDRTELASYALGWLIKAFFLPLMIGGLAATVRWLGRHPLDAALVDVFEATTWLITLALFVNLAFVSAGYIVTLRVLDSHIRSVNPLVLGWVVALICYEPFWSAISNAFLHYGDTISWREWIRGSPLLAIVWGGLIVAAQTVWVSSAVIFGLRFSNLTHRGIITGGPFRFTKHPSYIAKNISWWLISVPFISDLGPVAAFNSCLLLLGVNAIYLARARTEEAHLSADPTYVAYAMWMSEHGVFRGIGRILPWLAYRPPQHIARVGTHKVERSRPAPAE